MKVLGWLRAPGRRGEGPGWLLLAVAVGWGVVRTGRSLQILFETSHDLNIYYSLWYLLSHRDYADVALSQALYLPHTWLVLTPLFLLGWPAAKVGMLLINVGCVGFLWWRLSELTGLLGVRRWLLLALLWDWLCTGLVAGLGNLALVCVAAALAAFPYTSMANSWFLALSAMKQSLVLPLYLHLLFRRPKMLIVPALVIGASGAAVLWWARLWPAEMLGLARGSLQTVEGWTMYDLTSLRRLLGPVLGPGAVLTGVVWGVWLGLYAGMMTLVREPLRRFAALLLLSLLPVYHQEYDLVAAAPLLALLLARGPLVWPALMTLLLALNHASAPVQRLPAGLLREAAQAGIGGYNPLLVLAFLGAIVWLEKREEQERLNYVMRDA